MNPHDWFVERQAGYATRTLDPADEREFTDHLRRCDECRRAVQALERDLGWLPMGVTPVQPRPGFRWQVARTVLGNHRPSRARVWAPLAVAAAALLALAGTWRTSHTREASLTADLVQARGQLAALGDTLDILKRAAKVLQASIEMDGHEGGLLIFADSVTHRWNVVMHGLPPAPAGEKYQFWFICQDGMVRGIELSPDPSRPVFVTVGMPAGAGPVLGAALSVEPMTNHTDKPAGKELAHLML